MLTARARPIISVTPTSSEAPCVKPWMSSFSGNPLINIMRIVIAKKEAAI